MKKATTKTKLADAKRYHKELMRERIAAEKALAAYIRDAEKAIDKMHEDEDAAWDAMRDLEDTAQREQYARQGYYRISTPTRLEFKQFKGGVDEMKAYVESCAKLKKGWTCEWEEDGDYTLGLLFSVYNANGRKVSGAYARPGKPVARNGRRGPRY